MRQLAGSVASTLRRPSRQWRGLVSTQSCAAAAALPLFHNTRPPSVCHAIPADSFSARSYVGVGKSKIWHTLRAIFRPDTTPRGLQERQDTYLILLALAHRELRRECQRERAQQTPAPRSPFPRAAWRAESREELQATLERAAARLDERGGGIHGLSQSRLRDALQERLAPQVTNLLTVARDAEEALESLHGDGAEEYRFSAEEAREYRDILQREYEEVCQLLKSRERTAEEADEQLPQRVDPIPYYETKKGALETVLTYFEWWPDDAKVPIASMEAREEREYLDEFGFAPNAADAKILPAMRYYHVRNLVRASLVRKVPHEDPADDGHDARDGDGPPPPPPRCRHSLLPLRSTVSGAGRGVFLDGFAPAGTLVALFPGQVWSKQRLVALQDQRRLYEDDPRDQLSVRYDGTLIDSRRSPYTVMKNLWALGHIVNHPPAPASGGSGANDVRRFPPSGPNCVAVPVDFTDRALGQGPGTPLRDYVPNEHAPGADAPSDGDGAVLRGLGLMARRDVADEELFYDYRLSPAGDGAAGAPQYPDWYHVWDQEALDNRWDGDGS